MWTPTKEKLPEPGKYVLGRYNGGNWNDSEDQHNVNCVVVKLKMGITEEERQQMKDGLLPDPEEGGWCLSSGHTMSKRSNSYHSEDQHSNNRVPYSWSTFGPSGFFGQDIEYWQEIEPLPGFDPKSTIYFSEGFMEEFNKL